MKTPDDDNEEFDRDAFDRGLEGDEDILFPSESNQEGVKQHDIIEAEKEANAESDDDDE